MCVDADSMIRLLFASLSYMMKKIPQKARKDIGTEVY
jgi:hypothetical protein